MLSKLSACWLILLILLPFTAPFSTFDLPNLPRHPVYHRGPITSRAVPLVGLGAPDITFSPVPFSATTRETSRLFAHSRLLISGVDLVSTAHGEGLTCAVRLSTVQPAILRL
jgi:hypothetical protein